MSRAGYHQVPHDTILPRYFAHDNGNVTVQQFYDYQYNTKNFSHGTSRYLCHRKKSEFIDGNESILQELEVKNQVKTNKTKCTAVAIHTDQN